MEAGSESRGVGFFRVSVARLMALVAAAAVLCSAWLYRREHADIERSWATIHLRGLHQDEAAERRRAAESLDRAEADDMARVVSGLAGAMGDPDWQVRRASARSLGNVIARCAATPGSKASIDEIALAMRALVPALDDRRTEVRIAAMRSVGKLGNLCRAARVAVGPSAAGSVVLPEAEQASAALLRAMRDPAIDVRAEAVRSLAHVGPPAGIESARNTDVLGR